MESFYGGVPGRNAIVKTFLGGEDPDIYPTPSAGAEDPQIWYGDYFAATIPDEDTAGGQLGIYIKIQDDPGYSWTGIALYSKMPQYEYIEDGNAKALKFYNISDKNAQQ